MLSDEQQDSLERQAEEIGDLLIMYHVASLLQRTEQWKREFLYQNAYIRGHEDDGFVLLRKSIYPLPREGLVIGVQELFFEVGDFFPPDDTRTPPPNQHISVVGDPDEYCGGGVSYWQGPCPVWNPQRGRTILAVPNGARNRVILFDTATRKRIGRELKTDGSFEKKIMCLGWESLQGTLLYTCHLDGTILSHNIIDADHCEEEPCVSLLLSNPSQYHCGILAVHPTIPNLFAGIWFARESVEFRVVIQVVRMLLVTVARGQFGGVLRCKSHRNLVAQDRNTGIDNDRL